MYVRGYCLVNDTEMETFLPYTDYRSASRQKIKLCAGDFRSGPTLVCYCFAECQEVTKLRIG
jgi:hypothetical protein